MKRKEATFLIEADKTIGLGHFMRAVNFMKQSQILFPDLWFNIVLFGDFQLSKLDFSHLNIKDFIHLSSCNCAFNYLLNIPKAEYDLLGLFEKDSVLPYLFVDISLTEDSGTYASIKQLNAVNTVVGFYNKTNGIHDMPFQIHINPNYFSSNINFNDFPSSAHYLLGTDFRVFSEDVMIEAYLFAKQKLTGPKNENISSKAIFESTDEMVYEKGDLKLDNDKKTIKILLVAGNTDPSNRLQQILNKISEIDKNLKNDSLFEFLVIVPKNINFKQNFNSIDTSKQIKVVFYDFVNQLELIELYKIVDASITSVGGTFWELNLFQVPCLLIPGSLNENTTAHWLNKNNTASLLLESHETIEDEHILNIVDFLNSIEQRALNRSYGVKMAPNGAKRIWMELEKFTIQNNKNANIT